MSFFLPLLTYVRTTPRTRTSVQTRFFLATYQYVYTICHGNIQYAHTLLCYQISNRSNQSRNGNTCPKRPMHIYREYVWLHFEMGWGLTCQSSMHPVSMTGLLGRRYFSLNSSMLMSQLTLGNVSLMSQLFRSTLQSWAGQQRSMSLTEKNVK